ncbi:MAG: hypothetical protein IJX46_10475 [Clostridia bacterium]|nr:hypothetical protein [Clostridia bacterium]
MQTKNKEELKKELARRKAQNKRIIIRAFVVIIALAVLGITYATCVNLISGGFFENVINDPANYHFFEPDYEYNIFEDPEYADILESDSGKIHYSSDDRYFVSVDEEDFDRYGDAAGLMFDLVTAIRNGNSAGYNACFSEQALKNFGRDKFTMQQIYDVRIIFVEATNVKDDDGVAYQLSRMSLEYKIRRNNGTFTKDIGSDMSARQTFWISESNGSDKVLIDDVDTEYIIPDILPTEPNVLRIVVASIIVIAISVAVISVTFATVRKTATDEKKAEIKARRDKKREAKAEKKAANQAEKAEKRAEEQNEFDEKIDSK